MAMTPTMVPVEQYVVEMLGGLDQKTPTLKVPPGMVRDAVNFEVEPTGGYTRIAGYERIDGRASPSDAAYIIIQVVSFTNTPVVGQTLTGGTSGATGTIIAVLSPYVALTSVTGTFTTTEVVSVGATTIGTATTQTVTISALLNAQYINLAADVYRALITLVPGSGTIRGIVSATFSGVHRLYAFRDNVTGTFTDIYKSTTSGWTAVPFFNEVSFTAGGTATPADGDTVTQGGNTATIKRVMLQSGTWAGSSAAGRLIITTPAPANFAAGAATIGATSLTLSGVQTAITLATGGKFQFDLGNFAGQAITRRIYGSDGANRCFEFDGTTLAPIASGFTPDTPTYIAVHRNHLFIGIGSSIGNSGVGTPYNWTALAGGAEIAVGDTVTGLKVLPGNQASPSMLVSTRNGLNVLYGTAATGSNPWSIVSFNTDTGAMPYSLQNFNRTYMLDDRGVVDLETVQAYGNFRQATLTQNLQTFINEKRSLLTYSATSKDRSQYRLFFSDKSGLYVSIINGKLLGCMPVLFANAVSCAWQSEDLNGDDVSYFGSTNGMVYQLDKGSSFDGTNIDAYFVMNWNAMGSPRLLKRYRKLALEVQGTAYAAFSVGYQLGYGSSEIDQPNPSNYTSSFSAAYWDAMVWDAFTWDGSTLAPSEIEMSGTAENYQATISTTTDYLYAFTINSMIVQYSMRRRMR